MARTARKISVSLPNEIIDGLDRISASMGVTRSALLAGMLNGGVQRMVEVLDHEGVLEGDVQVEEVRRSVRSSLEQISNEVRELQEHVGTSH